MNEEEKKAIYKIQRLVEYFEDWNLEYTVVPEDKKYFDSLLNLIEKQQKELEPIKKLNIPVETLVSEFNRLEDLEDNTEMLKSELKKKDAVIDKIAEMLVEDKEWFYSEFDNYTKQDFIKHFTNLVEKESK